MAVRKIRLEYGSSWESVTVFLSTAMNIGRIS
jgi:hypothetical protein